MLLQVIRKNSLQSFGLLCFDDDIVELVTRIPRRIADLNMMVYNLLDCFAWIPVSKREINHTYSLEFGLLKQGNNVFLDIANDYTKIFPSGKK